MTAEIFTDALQRVMQGTLAVGQLIGAAERLNKAGQTDQAITLYRVWIEHNPDNSILHAVYFNYAVVLNAANRLVEARSALSEAIRLKPDFFPPYINLGHVLDRMGAGGDAVLKWQEVVQRLAGITGETINFKMTALKQIGRVLERGFLDGHAEETLKAGLDIDPDQNDVAQHFVSLRQRQCKWPVIQPFGSVTREKLLGGISALSLGAYTDDPMLLLANAYRYCLNSIGRPPRTFVDTHQDRITKRKSDRLKIGYLSSDLREHAIGFLTSEMYELHDRAKVEVYLYYCGIPADDGIKARIKATGDHWLDLGPFTDEEAAQRIVDDEIDILIDVNGYTNGARQKMLSMRPAPIIVNWLGYPGSLGSPFHNYVIADPFIVPKESEIYYAEKVVHLPCYQPNDRKRVISESRPTRAEVGLPDDAVVFCCFNGAHKITPFTWRRWMQILQQVPGSVLWLLDSIQSTNDRLKDLAQQQGIDPARIVFAAKRRNPDHLARYPLADLFLDTSPYGAHTTCSDAMWMGVPVITLVGRSFPSRVCGSLVKSAGMDELICYTPEDFVARAVEYGNDRDRREALKEKLRANRDSCVLFDTPLLVKSLEDLYRDMWRDFANGDLPRPDLSNLDIYHDIGVALDKDDVELLAVPNYNELYRQKLADRHTYSYLRADARLWPGELPKAARKAPHLIGGKADEATLARYIAAHTASFPTALQSVLGVSCTLKIVDIGANPVDGPCPYQSLLESRDTHVVGFEPNLEALGQLNTKKGPRETYLPHAVADGRVHTLRHCVLPGMSSLLEPNPAVLKLFDKFSEWGRVVTTQEVATVRLDDVPETAGMDLLKIDIQGGELMAFQNARQRLADALVIHTEVEFLPMYKGQPLFAEIEAFLREQGYMLHRFEPLVTRDLSPILLSSKAFDGHSQALWADAIFVRDITRLEALSDDQLLRMATILYDCYRSYDVVLLLLREHDRRTQQGYGAKFMNLVRPLVNVKGVV
jgi:FkbM family methyltransferase